MKKTYTNKLPQGMEVKSTNVRVENGKVLVDVEFEDKFQPKDGDFLVSAYGNTFIYSDMPAKDKLSYSSYCGDYRICGGISIEFSNNWTRKEGCRFATPEEKSDFLARLEKKCSKRWNPETKELEDIRWRANKGEGYWYIQLSNREITDNIIINILDSRDEFDNYKYDTNNYFRTEQAAQKVADQIKEIFKNSKVE